jgi:histidinol phosphatase-like enzyme (inositol monophosphatase family)
MTGTLPEYAKFLKFAESMADVTGPMLGQAFLKRPAIEIKGDASFVTAHDKEIERVLREMIADEYPDHGIHGEEFESENIDAEFVWVLDPIDGTAQFIAGIPVFGTLIALAWNGRPFLGVINHPATSDRWVGVVDSFATRNNQPASTISCSGPESAYVTCSNPDFMTVQELDRFARLREVAAYVQYGGSCFAYGLLASGRTNIAIDSCFSPFDFFACAAVISGAGGILSNWEGEGVTLDWNGGILASGNVGCHHKTIELLAT